MLSQKSWRYLRREFANAHRSLSALTSSEAYLQSTLSPAASIAWWVHTFSPDLLDRERLHILVAGAGSIEAKDSGRWFRLLPWLLGRPDLEVEVTLVGDELASFDNGRPIRTTEMTPERLALTVATSARPFLSHLSPVAIVSGTLADWHKSKPPRPDLVVLFSPGFESHFRSWLARDELLPLLRQDVPIAAFSYTDMDYLTDIYFLQSCGIKPECTGCTNNPWAGHGSESFGRFAGVAWRLRAPSVGGSIEVDETRIRAWSEVSDHRRVADRVVGDDIFALTGAPLSEFADDDVADAVLAELDDLVLLPDGKAVKLSTGQLFRFNPRAAGTAMVEIPGREAVPEEVLAMYPGPVNALERIIWACLVHRDYVFEAEDEVSAVD